MRRYTWTADNGRRLLIAFPARFRETVEGLMKCRGPVSKTVTRLETDEIGLWHLWHIFLLADFMGLDVAWYTIII